MKRKKRKWQLMLFLPFWLLIIAMFSGLIIIQLSRYSDYARTLASVQADIAKEQKAYDDLQDQMVYYDSDAYIEQIARDQLGYVKPDEIIFVNTAN